MGLVDITKTDRLEVPDEAGQWIEVRSLLATEMDEARETRLTKIIARFAGEKLPDVTPPAVEQEETLEQRAVGYDALTLIKYAVVAWSYDVEVKPGKLEHVELLDIATRDWLVLQVVERNTRPLPSNRSSNGHSNLVSVPENSDTLMISEEPGYTSPSLITGD